ncbi:MAG: peptidase domain-containing ABC transporter [Proteobacteria bacterium]|nr:peptidase domain-containing ABC transporter [Pseudomonadota bacterium]
MDLRTPIESDDLVWAFASLASVSRLPFEARLFLQQFPPPSDVATVRHAAAALGLRVVEQAFDAHALLGGPALVVSRATEGSPRRLGLALAADREAVVVAGREGAPRTLPMSEFRAGWEPQMLLLRPDEPAADAERVLAARPFGLGWFVPELLRHRTLWRDVLVASLVLQLVSIATPLFTQVVIDKVIVHHAQSTLTVILAALALFVLFGTALAWARQYLLLHTGNRIDAVLGMRALEHLLRLPPRYFDTRPTGTLVARLHGVETIREFITGAAATVVLDVPFALVFLAIMFWYSVALTLVALAAITLLALLALAVTPLLRKRINRQFLLGARNQAFLTEYVSAMETVKALQMEPQLAARYGRQLAEYLQASFATRSLANAQSVLASGIEQALTVSILGLGAWLVMSSEGFTIGMLVAFQMFSTRLAQPALRLAGLWQEFQQAAIAVQRLGDLMDAPAELYALRPTRAPGVSGAIEIDDVSYRYSPERPLVFERFSLQIAAGACVALTGPSGSGKSTLAKLLLGFCVPESGAVRVDGCDTRNLSANELRLRFGVVPQETRLFSGSIYENLVLAHPHAAFEEVVAACRQAEIHEVIESLPQGYQTQVGEHGAGLSGGQKQRLAIARALLRRPPILVFDEATASLDREAAEAVGRTVSRLRGQVTILFIAHHVPSSLQVDAVARLESRVPVRLTPRATRTGA